MSTSLSADISRLVFMLIFVFILFVICIGTTDSVRLGVRFGVLPWKKRTGPDEWHESVARGSELGARMGAGGSQDGCVAAGPDGADRSWGPAKLDGWHADQGPDGADRSWGPATLDGWHGSELAARGSGWVARGLRWGSD